MRDHHSELREQGVCFWRCLQEPPEGQRLHRGQFHPSTAAVISSNCSAGIMILSSLGTAHAPRWSVAGAVR